MDRKTGCVCFAAPQLPAEVSLSIFLSVNRSTEQNKPLTRSHIPTSFLARCTARLRRKPVLGRYGSCSPRWAVMGQYLGTPQLNGPGQGWKLVQDTTPHISNCSEFQVQMCISGASHPCSAFCPPGSHYVSGSLWLC